MNLYALLIGINDYQSSPLQQCVNDVLKIEEYLHTLHGSYTLVSIKKLTDKKATKNNIIHTISTFLTQADDNDVVLLYYSGHGALEESNGRFTDAHTGSIECLVCYDDVLNNENYLLADKELRYLFSKFENDPHIITLFDCCHSGDMVRATSAPKNQSRQRKVHSIFPPRTYEDFIFSSVIEEKEVKSLSLASLIPYKNTVNISACLSSESAWEDHKGGVFTRYLLQLLKAKDSQLPYIDIANWAKISLKDITHKKQTPTITIQGEGKMNHHSSWLGLYPDQDWANQGQIFYNNKSGWYYNRGQLFGIKEGTKITIHLDEKNTCTSEIVEVSLEDSLIKDPMEFGISLDLTKSYYVTTETTHHNLNIYINDIDHDQLAKEQLTTIINNTKSVTLTAEEKASFCVVIFNQTVYITLPNDYYRPLAIQIDLLETSEAGIEKMMSQQLNALVKWNHYHTLINPDSGFTTTPIKVEIKTTEDQPWKTITDLEYDLVTLKDQYTNTGESYQKYQIRVSNISNEAIFVTALLLSSDIAISAAPLDNIAKKLKPGEAVMFYEHRSRPYAGWSFDTYKEIYNWKSDWLYYKFIVNNQEDITTTIPSILQDALLPPITHVGNAMGHGAITDFVPQKAKWDVYTTTLRLINPNYNIIGQKILKNWDWYANHEVLAPFISAIYTDKISDGFTFKIINKPNALGDKELNSKNVTGLKLTVGNFLDDRCRYRKFKKSKKRFPDLPVIVAEGDSWFLFPFLVKDTIDYVMEKYPVRSIAAAGDEIQNYRKSGQLLKEIKKEKPRYVLISGGGNDIIGPKITEMIIEGVPSGLEPMAYLNENFKKKMDSLYGDYNYFFNRIFEFDFVEQVFVHGYDYVRADLDAKTIKNGWVNKYLIEKGIPNAEDRFKIIAYLIDSFNELLKNVTQKHRNATLIDMRGLVLDNEWYDEIHPNDIGFAKIGGNFLNAINQFQYIQS